MDLIIAAQPLFSIVARITETDFLQQQTPMQLREYLREKIDTYVNKCQKLSLTAAEVDDARYALVTLLDKTIIASQWLHADDWLAQSLQAYYYQEQIAGQRFHQRLQNLLSLPHTNADLMEIYACCLQLGFSECPSEFDVLKTRLLSHPEQQQPSDDVTQNENQHAAITLYLAAVAIGLLVIYLVCYLSITVETQSTLDWLNQLTSHKE